MIFQGNRLSHLRLPCFAFRQTEPFPLYAERVPISFNTLLGRYTSVSGNHGGYITRVSYRNYADRAVSRPKAHTGRTTTASSKKAATTTKVTVKPKTKTAKEKAKPKPKPGTKAKAKPRAKPKAKRKPISKRKTKAKAKPRPRKKILTEQQKEKLAANKARQNIRHLKATALDPPEQKKGKNVFTVVLSEISKEPDFAKAAIGPLSREAGARYKALSPERREHYNLILIQEKAAAEAAYRQWLKSYTPDQIRLANIARRALIRRGLKKYKKLADERQVAPPLNAYAIFTKDRRASKAYSGFSFVETTKLIAQEWHALPAADKKKLEDLQSQDRQRYVQEMKGVYNADVQPQRSKTSATGAA